MLKLFLGLGISLLVYKVWKARRSIDNHPGNFFVLGFLNALAAIYLPPIPYITPGTLYHWEENYKPFIEYGWDIFSSISLWPFGITLFLGDAAVIKEVSLSRARFPKPTNFYEPVDIYGRNLLTTEGDEWKRHKKVIAPAFSERNHRLVWEATVEVMAQLFKDVWMDKESVSFDSCRDLTFPIALFVIGAAGFGIKISWTEEDICPPGHNMSFKQALHIVSESLVVRAVLPKPILTLVPRFRKIDQAFNELGAYMSRIIRERLESTEKAERHDLLSLLVDSSQEDKQNPLTEQEVMGNTFLFLVAGHETTSQTLTFTFALLALYPEEQELVYKEIKALVPDGSLPPYSTMPLLVRSLAVYYETLRLFPPGADIPKVSAEDTTLTATNLAGETKTIPVPKGTFVSFSIAGLHHNPRYWKDPDEFMPGRFLEDWPREAFVPFSAGTRSCVGRRFFETEAIATMAMLLSRYKITIKEEPQFAGETWEQRKKRVLSSKAGVTLTPIRVPLTFTRR